MTEDRWRGGSLLSGPLSSPDSPWPLSTSAVLCDLRSRFLPKCRVGGGYRSISRNGRVLLCSDRPLGELVERPAFVRLQGWRKPVLPGDWAEPYGLLLCVRTPGEPNRSPRSGWGPFWTRLSPFADGGGELYLDIGGGICLEFYRADIAARPGRGGNQ